MDINELESFRLSDAIKFHDKLNPALWTEKGELDPEVKDKLMEIAKDFIAELGISTLKVEDITISGSNAAYTYTPHSDLDLHILVDFNKLSDDEVYQELFNAKKTLYNDTHNIKVHGVPVELYVQDSNQPVVSLGEYSLLKNEWLKIPKKRRANFDQSATKLKYEKLGSLVELALRQKDIKKIDQVLKTIKRYRKAGLDTTGEFGPENLAFKALRKQGYIKKLYDLKNDLHSRELSIEDYDPNGPPPGPEFKPTMPAGTVRVDVSDVYDWYKLGQHISNMKGLGKHDFGQGPPSTILSFGDEDTEHKYIQDLEKTGLTTTDIDPVDPNQPKGMKRQKVDPTFNVNEKINPEITKPGFTAEKTIKTTKGPIKLIATTPSDSNEVFPQFYIKGYNKEGKQVSYLRLNMRDLEKFSLLPWKRKDFKNSFLVAGNVSVYDEYQRLGIASEMYKFAKELGNDIKPSSTQTDAGKAMWRGFEKNKVVDEGAPDNYDFEEGDCPIFAIALHKLTNLPIYGLVEYIEEMDDFALIHAYVKTKDGQVLDANGLTTVENILNTYPREGYEEPQEVKFSIKDLLKIGYGGNKCPTLQEILPHAKKLLKDINLSESASGYIPSNAQKNDPRFKTALTKDVRPDSIKKNAKAFGFNVTRAGIPPLLRK